MAENKFRVKPGVNQNSKNKLLYNPNERKRKPLGNFSDEEEKDQEQENREEVDNLETKENNNEEENDIENEEIEEPENVNTNEVVKEQIKEIANKKIILFFMSNPLVAIVIVFILLVLIVLLAYKGSLETPPDLKDYEAIGGEKYWWPVGGKEEINGMAIGEPSTVYISSPFGDRIDPITGVNRFHSGLDIANSGENFIIASISGKVLVALNGCVEGMRSCGSGFGNHVILEHNDGVQTVYAHLKEDTIRVTVGEEVKQGQILANMGSTGYSTGRHLHFGVKIDGTYVNPLDYISKEKPRAEQTLSSSEDMSLLKTKFTKAEFISHLKNYSNNVVKGDKKINFDNNFLQNAELIYNKSNENGINPEIVLMWANVESEYRKCNSYYNFWGIGISNGEGCSDGPHYSSMEEGVTGFAKVIKSYQNKDSSLYKSIMNRFEERKNAGCRQGGYGTPDTLEGLLSVYSWFGEYLANPGSSGDGGCYYINYWVQTDFLSDTYNETYLNNRCSSNYKCASSRGGSGCVKATICEQSDYTIYGSRSRLNTRKSIFGY